MVETTTPVVSVTVDGEYTVVAGNAATGCTATRSATLASSLHPDYLPLVDFYRSTNGPNWVNNTGWLSSCEPCNGWYGVQCVNNRVVLLSLNYNKLDGSLPTSISRLTKLHTLGANNNQLKGKIPFTLYSMTALQQVLMGANQLSDTISNAIGNLSNLTTIFLQENQINGKIPESMTALSQLGQIILYGNQLTGTIPPGLTKLTQLTSLRLAGNRLSGTIPYGFSSIPGLQNLDLSFNQLTGDLPKDIGNLKSIVYLLLSANRLTGCFPESLKNVCGGFMISLYANQGLPRQGDLSGFCENGEGNDQFITTQVSQSVVQSNSPVTLSAMGGASYTWTAPFQASLTGAATNSAVSALLMGSGVRTFTLVGSNSYCMQTTAVSVTSVEHSDYIPLLDLYLATNGPGWTNASGWFTSYNPCSGWYGVSCQNGRVSSLLLPGNQLQGYLPASLSSLTMLQTLDLANNRLSGCFPASLTAFCGRMVNMSSNPLLPGGGDWAAFCQTGLGKSGFVASAGALPNPAPLGQIVSVTASGGTVYRWAGPQNFTGTSAKESFSLVSPEQQGVYSVTVGNGSLSCSAVATTSLTINAVSCVKLQPLVSSSAICTRGIATVSVSATSPEPLSYQWYKGTNPLQSNSMTIGATSATLTLADIALSQAGSYYVVASSGCGSTTSTSFSLSVSPPTHPDYVALADLFYATNGLSWNNRDKWLTNCDPCSGWAGVYCYEKPANRVNSLRLNSNGLSGSLPESITTLTTLHVLYVSGNKIGGTIPGNFSAMKNLTDLLLNDNQFTGVIPVIRDLPVLRILWLYNNQLSGDFPTTMENLPAMEAINFSNNRITGSIPQSFSVLPQLLILKVSDNLLSGNLPESLSGLQSLIEISLERNQITGTIPAGLSRLKNLSMLSLSQNQFSGTLPPWLGNMTTLRSLYLSYNRLRGPVPDSFSALIGLQALDLSGNQLTGEIPASYSTLNGLASLDLSNNQLTGSIPFGFGTMTNLQSLYLNNNQLTGSIPSSFSRFSKMRTLLLHNNQLSGCIPASLTALCASDIYVNISGNSGLPGGGNWQAFCSRGAGSYTGTLTTTKAGTWADGSVWTCGAVPQAGDRVIVQHPVTVTPVPLNIVNQIRFEGAGKLIYQTGSRLQIK